MPAGLLNGSSIPVSGDNLLDAMTNGYRWQLDSSRTVDWSISNGWNGEYWTDPESAQNHLNVMFAVYSYYANIKFNYLGYFSNPLISNNAGSDINIAVDQYSYGSQLWALGYFPKPNDPNRGDIYINTNSAANRISYAPGSAGWFLGIHEIGHTLGLKHPHDDGGTERPTFTQLGWTNLDIDYATAMSYEDNYDFNLRQYDPATPMILDVLAIQYLYGKNTSTNMSDSIFELTNSKMYSTIWDSSGLDLIDQKSAAEGWHIVLPNTQLSTLVDTKAGWAMPLSDVNLVSPRTLVWLAGDIENANGSNHKDQIYGNQQNNIIFGEKGNDLINGGGGEADWINGGEGIDLAVYSGFIKDYFLSVGEYKTVITDKIKNRDGTDTVEDLERLQFNDINIALDIEGNAGKAYRIYEAVLGRTPDRGGLGYWINDMDNGVTLTTIASGFIASKEFKDKYGTNPSYDTYINLLYQNILGRNPDKEGLDYWVSNMEKGIDSPAAVLASFSEGFENKANVAPDIANGIYYTPWVS